MKNNIYQPKTIMEAIDSLQEFLECDLYLKFRPEHKVNKVKWYRQDSFKNEKEFKEYLEAHFKILKKEIRRLKR